MLNTTKTLKDDMLVGDLVDNHEFDINCNFEIYDCTKLQQYQPVPYNRQAAAIRKSLKVSKP